MAVVEKTKDNELFLGGVRIPAYSYVDCVVTLESADDGGILDIVYVGYDGGYQGIAYARYIQGFWLLSNSLSLITNILNITGGGSETFTISFIEKGSSNKVKIRLEIGGEYSSEIRGSIYVRGYLANGHIYNLALDS
jgi:hypothetical protein